jgi:hypothetical protein
MAKRRFPLKLHLLPGLRWRGTVKVTGPAVRRGPGHPCEWYVEFDAEIVDPSVSARFVFDRTALTTKQVKDWTGVDLGVSGG